VKGEKAVERTPRAWPRYMTARVAADYADTSVWTIRRYVPPCGRRGRSFVYTIEDVERWMRGQPIASQVVTDGGVVRQQPKPADTSIERIRALARQRGDETSDDLADVERGMSR
jgi:hypothetical protein